MLTYLFKRLLIFVPTLLFISLVAFGLNRVAPGDPMENNLEPEEGAGIEDYRYYENAYLSIAERMGLDRPVFYFTFTAAAYPDTLHRIVNRDKIFTLEKLIANYGNWEEIEAYTHQIRNTELTLYSWPDSIAKEVQIVVRKTLGQLYFSHKVVRINSLLGKMQTALDEVLPKYQLALSPIRTEIDELVTRYQKMTTETSRAKLYQPIFYWNGFDNQYHNWLMSFISGDFGISYSDSRPVTDKIGDAVWWTLVMNLMSFFLIFLFSIPLGVFAAQKQGRLFDRVSSFLLFLFYSIPGFWLATMLVIFFTTPQYGWPIFASIGLGNLGSDAPFWDRFWERMAHLVLPVFCITYASLAFISRQVRSGMLSVIRQDYVRTARAKGLSENKVIWQHAFRNALFPLITIFAVIFPATLAGSVVVEVIFNIPGMGRLMFESILSKDWPVVITVLMLVAVLTMIGNLVADFLFAVADPRVTFTNTNVSR